MLNSLKQPQALVPLEQANNNGVGPFVDPTAVKLMTP